MIGPEDDKGNGIGRRRKGAQLIESRRSRGGLPKGGDGDAERYDCRAVRPEHLRWNREHSGPPKLQGLRQKLMRVSAERLPYQSSLSGNIEVQVVHFERSSCTIPGCSWGFTDVRPAGSADRATHRLSVYFGLSGLGAAAPLPEIWLVIPVRKRLEQSKSSRAR